MAIHSAIFLIFSRFSVIRQVLYYHFLLFSIPYSFFIIRQVLCYCNYYCSLRVFHISVSLWSFTGVWVTASFLSILAVLDNAVVWMVSTRTFISKSSCHFTNLLVTVPTAPITIVITLIFMFQFFQFPNKDKVIVLLFIFFQFYSVISQDSKVNNFTSSLFFINY